MNSVNLMGRITADPETRYAGDLAVASFSIAIDRPPRKDGTKETDFPRIKIFGRQAEFCETWCRKGNRVAITGRIETGSYTNRDGVKVYTTEVVADRVEIIDWPEKKDTVGNREPGFYVGGGEFF